MAIADNFENLHFEHSINLIDAPNYPTSYPLHWHKYVELAYLPEDCSSKDLPVIQCNQKTYTLYPGDVFFIWPGDLHETRKNHSKTLLGMQFTASILNEQPDFIPFLHLFRAVHLFSYNDAPHMAQCMHYHLGHILTLDRNKEAFYHTQKLICLLEMFMEFGQHLKETRFTNGNSVTDYSVQTLLKIQDACSYIVENCEQDLTLDALADYVGFSPSYFSRIFKQATNFNFVEYLSLQRVKKAQLLLSDSDISITEIAYQSGFKSISTFNRVFHQLKGFSPSEYRKYYV